MQVKDRNHILVISHDIIGSHMAGPGIRYYHLARVLAREFPVTLAAPLDSNLPHLNDFAWVLYRSGQDPLLEQTIRQVQVVLVPAVSLTQIPSLYQTQAALVIDGYDPIVAETLYLSKLDASRQQIALTRAYLAGDFFICGSERQRDWWLGILEANGRINAQTYDEDLSFRKLIDTVPFGLPVDPPRHTRQTIKGIWRGIENDDRVILWGGGLWSWLDPFTAIRAVAQVRQKRRDVKLIFPGVRHPNPTMAQIPTHAQAARDLAQQLGLLDRVVFFGEWHPYDDWQNVLLESDIALMLDRNDSLETRLAFRSRVLDYIWAGVPVVATCGDATSELIAQNKLGILVDAENVDEAAQAILRLLDTPREAMAKRFRQARVGLTWERVVQPLIEFCRHPRRAPDKIALGNQLGNPFYTSESVRLEAMNEQLQAENAQLDSAQTQLQLENTRLASEIAQLHAENTQLDSVQTQLQLENTRLTSEIAQLHAENAQLDSVQAQLRLENTRLTSEIAQLTELVQAYERRRVIRIVNQVRRILKPLRWR